MIKRTPIIEISNVVKSCLFYTTIIIISSFILSLYYGNPFFYSILLFIPIIYLEDKNISNWIKLVYVFFMGAVLIYIYEVFFKPILPDQYITSRITLHVMSWCLFGIFCYIAYLLAIFIKRGKSFLPKSSSKSLSLLFILGLLFIIFTLINLNLSYSNHQNLDTLSDKFIHYKSLFSLAFITTGITCIILFQIFKLENSIKIITISTISIYILSFFFSFLIIYLAFSGMGILANIFPLNIITFIMINLAMKCSIVFASFGTLWGLILGYLEKTQNYKYSLYTRLLIIILLSILILFLKNSFEIEYPFNKTQFN